MTLILPSLTANRRIIKPNRWNWKAREVRADYRSEAQDMYGCVPFWENGGTPKEIVTGQPLSWTGTAMANHSWQDGGDSHPIRKKYGQRLSSATTSLNSPVLPRPWPMTSAHGYTYQIVFTPNYSTSPNYTLGGNSSAGDHQMCWFFGSVIYHRPGDPFDNQVYSPGFLAGNTYNVVFTNSSSHGSGWQAALWINGEYIAEYAASTPGGWADGGIKRVHGFPSNYNFRGDLNFTAFHKRALSPRRALLRSRLDGWQGLLERDSAYTRTFSFPTTTLGFFKNNACEQWTGKTQDIQEKSGLAWDDRTGEKYFYSHNNSGTAVIQRLDVEGNDVGASFNIPGGLGAADIESIEFLGAAGFDYDDGTSNRTFHWAFLEEGDLGGAPNDHPRIYLLTDMDSTTTVLAAADFAIIELDDITTESSYGAEGLCYKRGTNEFFIVVQKTDSEGALWKVEVFDNPTAPTVTKIIDTSDLSDAGYISSDSFAGDLAIGNADMGTSEHNLFIMFNDGQNSAAGDTGRKIIEVTPDGQYLSTFVHSLEWQCEGLAFTDDRGDGTVDFGLVLEAQSVGDQDTWPTFWLYSSRSVTVLPWLSSGKKSDDDTDQYVPATPFYDNSFDDSSWDAFTGPGGDPTITMLKDTWHEEFGSTFNTALSITGRRTLYVTYEFEVTQAQIDACDEVVHRHITDSGCAVWLNGTLAFEFNTPATLSHAGRAPSVTRRDEEGNKHEHISTKANLVAGTNRLAIMNFNEGGADVCVEHRIDLRADPAAGGPTLIAVGDASGAPTETVAISVVVPVADASGSPVEVVQALAKVSVADASGAPVELPGVYVYIPVGDQSGGVVESTGESVGIPVSDASGTPTESPQVVAYVPMSDVSGSPVEVIAAKILAAIADAAGAPVEAVSVQADVPVIDASGAPVESLVIVATLSVGDASGSPVEDISVNTSGDNKTVFDASGVPVEGLVISVAVPLADQSGGVVEGVSIRVPVSISDISGAPVEVLNVLSLASVGDQSGSPVEVAAVNNVFLDVVDASGSPVEALSIAVTLAVADASGSPVEVASGVDTANRIFSVSFGTMKSPGSSNGGMSSPGANFEQS